tara:strand:+ start:946 stop:1257 length:312 start_codon:yes stop_codon:yes gene_type:complete
MKNILIILLAIFIISCQREVKNELGLGYNKTLIVPPINDLPLPGATEKNNNLNNNDNAIINSILNQTQATDVDPAIINKIDGDSGYNTDENLFQKLFKGKSKR